MFIDNGNSFPMVPTETTVTDWTTPYQYVWYPATPPYACDGNVHVFGCDHAAKCKCGKTTRKPSPPVCGHCGKAHG